MRRLQRQITLGCTGVALLGTWVASTGVAAGVTPIPISARVLQNGEFPGYVRAGVRVITGATTWAKGNAFVTAADLRQAGFISAAFANMRATHQTYASSAISTVVQFRSRRGAVAYLVTFVADFLRVQGVKRFAVPKVPGAFGISHVAQSGGTYDAVFADGAFFYDITVFTNGPAESPSPAQVASAAFHLYSRVHHSSA